ncbi:MAG: ABC transporter permease [Geminicoccaceae bacterium]|nr:ABC transporter permease [Geminicoccaceae bacterium]MDW8370792.1 ABC transporter permease [Geminicoccaceae bacterium]
MRETPLAGGLALALLLLLAAPSLVVAGASLTAGEIVQFPPEGLSLRWYGRVLEAGEVRDAFFRSLEVATVCTLLALPSGTLAAVALARWRFRAALAIQLYLLLPFTVPLIGSGIGLMLLFGELGLLGRVWPVGVACCVINLPFMIWAVAAAVNALDPELERAAASCGAGPVQTFLLVTLPALAPGMLAGALVMFVLALNEFLVSLLLVDARTVTLPVQIYTQIRGVITPDLAAVSTVYVLVAAAAVLLLDRLVGLDVFLRAR